MNDLLIQAMKDLVDYSADDTVWIGAGETIFDRLAYIYRQKGGDEEVLKTTFPEYFK